MTTAKIKILKFSVGGTPLVLEIENTLKAMQDQVGGYIQFVGIGVPGLTLVCNEDGIGLDLPINLQFEGHIIYGDFFIVRYDDYHEGNVSLTEEDIQYLLGRSV